MINVHNLILFCSYTAGGMGNKINLHSVHMLKEG